MNVHDDEVASKLTSEQLHVLRDKGTEAPFSGKYFDHKEDGSYACTVCGSELFKSDDKYESDQLQLRGWPSFAELSSNDAVELVDDNRYGMKRVEVVCKTCGGHLGHVFPDNSSPTGQHYCINSVCLQFKPSEKTGDENNTL